MSFYSSYWKVVSLKTDHLLYLCNQSTALFMNHELSISVIKSICQFVLYHILTFIGKLKRVEATILNFKVNFIKKHKKTFRQQN